METDRTEPSDSSWKNAPPAVLASLGVASAVAWAGAQDGVSIAGLPTIAVAFALAFAAQWLAFIPAFVAQTERFYDFVGSLTYLGVTAFVLVATGAYDLRSCALAILVSLWAVRLGTFLFRRIRAEGKDGRFDDIKPHAGRFFVAWTLQGLWVSLTLSAALAAMTTARVEPLGWVDLVGLTIWIAGFSIEVIADRQKSRFRELHPGRFINTGLWAWSRHPNYFGEIVLWVGVATIAASTLHGWQFVCLISPLFVAFLLTRVSGIPLLERRADERWGDDPGYRRYKERTPALVPRAPRPG